MDHSLRGSIVKGDRLHSIAAAVTSSRLLTLVPGGGCGIRDLYNFIKRVSACVPDHSCQGSQFHYCCRSGSNAKDSHSLCVAYVESGAET